MPNHENFPEEPPIGNETFLQFHAVVSSEDWTIQERDQHKYLSGQICEIVGRYQNWLTAKNGFVLFEFCHDDSDYRLLWTNRDMKPYGSTGIVINQTRSSVYGEPYFPDGRTINMTDILINGRWLSVENSIQFRDHLTHNWQMPTNTTLLTVHNDKLFGHGNFQSPESRRTPLQSRHHTPYQLDDVIRNNQIMYDALQAILNCQSNHINKDLTRFSN